MTFDINKLLNTVEPEGDDRTPMHKTADELSNDEKAGIVSFMARLFTHLAFEKDGLMLHDIIGDVQNAVVPIIQDKNMGQYSDFYVLATLINNFLNSTDVVVQTEEGDIMDMTHELKIGLFVLMVKMVDGDDAET